MPTTQEIQAVLERKQSIEREASQFVQLNQAMSYPDATVELHVTVRNPNSPPARSYFVTADKDAVVALLKSHRGSADGRLSEVDASLRSTGIVEEATRKPAQRVAAERTQG